MCGWFYLYVILLLTLIGHLFHILSVTFDVREEAVGLGQPDAVAKYGIGESISRQGDVVEDDYGISVKAESFVDIVTGVDPSKFSGGTGRIGEEVTRRGLGFGVDGKQVVTSSGGGDADNLLNDTTQV